MGCQVKFTSIHPGIPGCAQDSSWLSRMAYDMSQIAPELIHMAMVRRHPPKDQSLDTVCPLYPCLVRFALVIGGFQILPIFPMFEILDVDMVIRFDSFDLVRLLCDLRDNAPQHHCGTDRGFLPNSEAGLRGIGLRRVW